MMFWIACKFWVDLSSAERIVLLLKDNLAKLESKYKKTNPAIYQWQSVCISIEG